jgi:hypothetical protein
MRTFAREPAAALDRSRGYSGLPVSARAPGGSPRAALALALQRSAGNRATTRIVGGQGKVRRRTYHKRASASQGAELRAPAGLVQRYAETTADLHMRLYGDPSLAYHGSSTLVPQAALAGAPTAGADPALPMVAESVRAVAQSARAMLGSAAVRLNDAVRSDLLDIAQADGVRRRDTASSVSVTIERVRRGRATVYEVRSDEAVILPVLAELARRSQSRGTAMAIVSLFRPGTSGSLHRNLRAVDIGRYAGHRFSEREPSASLHALKALLEDVPAGDYALGLPRLSRTEGQASMREDFAVPGYRQDYDRLVIADDEGEVAGIAPLFRPARRRRAMTEPFMEPSADRLYGSQVEQQIRHIRNRETRRRVREAIEAAADRGVHIVGVFRDQSSHIHLSVPLGGRM